MIEHNHPTLSVRRQCELLDFNRSNYYYSPAQESDENLLYMELIDKQYLKTPFYGSRRMTAILKHQGYVVNRKRIQRLMNVMGIEAIYPKPKTTVKNKEHKIYPYLLRGLCIDKPNQVWCTDITYVPMPTGFMYLTAVIDWYSRYVLSWRLSNTLETEFCIEAVNEALTIATPTIFNTDQGSQYTSHAFTEILDKKGIKISMDGYGRALDNIAIERLWRSVKYEDIYIKSYETVPDLERGLGEYFDLYNNDRPHQSYGYQMLADIYWQ